MAKVAPVVPNPEGCKLLFEAKICKRCGGSGKYSYCSVYGTVCFGCRGQGATLTKRGRAAAEFLHRLRQKPAADLQPGELMLDMGIDCIGKPAQLLRVLEVRTQEDGQTVVVCKAGKYSFSRCLAAKERQAAAFGLCAAPETVPAEPTETESFLFHPGYQVEYRGDKACEDAKRQQALAYQATLTKGGLEPAERR